MITNVTVFGSGVLGAQIAFQTAFHGFNVTLYDLADALLEKAREKFGALGDSYKRDLCATDADVSSALARLTYTTDLARSVADADLTIEAIPENIQIKKDFYSALAKVAPAKTIFCTNSSTLLPSQFAAETGRPERFLALHFANQIWIRNTAEIMGHPGTDPAVFDTVVAFAKAIGMVALPIHKEQPGYILNSLLVPFLKIAWDLHYTGVADPETIDKTWMIATGAPVGPFAIMDVVGLTTVYNISKLHADATGNAQDHKSAQAMKEQFVDQGKLGVLSGQGFYSYPDPAYLKPDFLK